MFLLEYEHTGNLIRELKEKTRIAENQLKEAQDTHSRTKDEYERLEKYWKSSMSGWRRCGKKAGIVLSVNNSCPVRSMFFMSRSWQESRTTVIIAAVF